MKSKVGIIITLVLLVGLFAINGCKKSTPPTAPAAQTNAVEPNQPK